jgi:ribosome-binding protein aMBF1 (putative translation factor)
VKSLDYKNSINHALKAKIWDKFKTQRVFSEKVGVSETTVSNWICYYAKPTYKAARKVEWLLKTPLKELFPRGKYGKITAN